MRYYRHTKSFISHGMNSKLISEKKYRNTEIIYKLTLTIQLNDSTLNYFQIQKINNTINVSLIRAAGTQTRPRS